MRWAQGAANTAAPVEGSNFCTAPLDAGATGERIVGAQSSTKGREGVETRWAAFKPSLQVCLQLHQLLHVLTVQSFMPCPLRSAPGCMALALAFVCKHCCVELCTAFEVSWHHFASKACNAK